MDLERIRPLCNVPKAEHSLVDDAWSSCRNSAPAASALLFGTAGGVVHHGLNGVMSNPSKAVWEGMGAVGIGVALKAAPKCVSVPAAIIGGAGTMVFAREACDAVATVVPVLRDASSNPDLAREQVAKNLGPVAFEGAAMCLIGAATGAATSHLNDKSIPSLRRTLRLAHRSEATRENTSLDDYRSYKQPVVDISYFRPRTPLKQRLTEIEVGPISRNAFGNSKEFKLYPLTQLTDDAAKHRTIKNFDPSVAERLSNSHYIAIPKLTREFTGIGLGIRPKDHFEAKLYEHAKDSVVKIQGVGNDDSRWSGTGFVVGADGKIATALHVVADARELNVVTSNGIKYDASLIAHDFDTDLAVLKINSKQPMKTLSLADSASSNHHDVFLFGHPAGSRTMFMSPALFHRTGFERACLASRESGETIYSGRKYQTTAYFAHDRTGNSGGPVLNADGKVIAVHTDGDVHAIDSYDEVRVGIGTSVRELSRLIESLPPSAEARNLVWKPSMLFQKPPTQNQPKWWSFLNPQK